MHDDDKMFPASNLPPDVPHLRKILRRVDRTYPYPRDSRAQLQTNQLTTEHLIDPFTLDTYIPLPGNLRSVSMALPP